MGEVWAGYDQQLGRRVAVKFVRFPDGHPDEELTRRFIRESRITARLQHPGVPAVYDAAAVTEPGLHHGQLYMVMQLVEGVSVADLIAEQGPLPQEWAALIVAQAAAVLAAAHAESLVHRDLKPSNLMLCPDATVKVLDFGLAAALEPSDLSRITSTGHVPGTPHYMAPEQLLYGVTSAHSDLYSLGCVLHELLTGRRPFSGATVFALARQHEETAPTPLRELRPDADPALERLVLDLLEKHPDRRPADATELYRRLLPFIGNPAPLPGVVDLTPGPVRLYAGAVALVGTTPPVQTSAPRKKPSRKDGPPQDAEPRPAPAPSEPALEDELEQVRRQAAELVAEARYEQAAELLSRQVEKSGRALGFDHEQTLNWTTWPPTTAGSPSRYCAADCKRPPATPCSARPGWRCGRWSHSWPTSAASSARTTNAPWTCAARSACCTWAPVTPPEPTASSRTCWPTSSACTAPATPWPRASATSSATCPTTPSGDWNEFVHAPWRQVLRLKGRNPLPRGKGHGPAAAAP